MIIINQAVFLARCHGSGFFRSFRAFVCNAANVAGQ
jgi:hypothetical protein